MSSNDVWETIFRNRASWGLYPPEELIRFVAAHYYGAARRDAVSFLEIGCGPGAGPSWYLAREGFRYTGIDGSPTAVRRAQDRFAREGLAGDFVVGELEILPWEDGCFDCVVDIAALQHNDEHAAAAIVTEVHRVLKPGGRHFSLTASDRSWGVGTGERMDETTGRNVTEGPYANMGPTRFATRESMSALYASFREVEINYSIRSVAHGTRDIANWIATCVR